MKRLLFIGVLALTACSSHTVTPPPPSITTLPVAFIGKPYSIQLPSPLPFGQFTLQSGKLPEGLALSTRGVLSGVPTRTCTSCTFTVSVLGAAQTAELNFQF